MGLFESESCGASAKGRAACAKRIFVAREEDRVVRETAGRNVVAISSSDAGRFVGSLGLVTW